MCFDEPTNPALSEMPDDGTDALSKPQHEAIVALLNEATVAKAAEVCGVSERTLYRWLSEPVFASAFRRARREAFSHAVGLCQRYSAGAVNALAKIAMDTTAPHASRVSAATNILKFGRESMELDDLAARVDALEAARSDVEGWRPAP